MAYFKVYDVREGHTMFEGEAQSPLHAVAKMLRDVKKVPARVYTYKTGPRIIAERAGYDTSFYAATEIDRPKPKYIVPKRRFAGLR